MILTSEELRKILIEPGHVTPENFSLAEKIAKQNKQEMIEVLTEKDMIRDEQLGQLIADSIGVSFVDLKQEKVDEKVLNLIPEIVARSLKAIAFGNKQGKTLVGLVDPRNIETRHILEKKFDANVKFFLITEKDFQQALTRYKKSLVDEINRLSNCFTAKEIPEREKDELIINLVDRLLEYSQISKASDVHLEPQIEKVVVRFRIDGVMHHLFDIPKNLYEAVVVRIKILSRIRIDEHRSAQDGKFRQKINNDYIDVRVSIVPVTNGENVVMRILSAHNRQMNLSSLGFWSKDFVRVTEAVKNPHGMILVTGPTGCGKTTSIYELLKIINQENIHIATIEDPVEYDIEGVSQIQVNPATNLTFAKGLRAIVRQDPDVILVGEIRDQETAQIAINSAMTGHLVLSTLHTNDAATTLPRLIDMGIEPFLIASTANIIIGQRLVRKICERCRYSYNISEEEKKAINDHPEIKKTLETKHPQGIKNLLLFKGEGCKVCAGSGYQGRTGIFEILIISDRIKKMIVNRSASNEIMSAAQEEGMTTMVEDGVLKVLNGITTIAELIRVTSGLTLKY